MKRRTLLSIAALAPVSASIPQAVSQSKASWTAGAPLPINAQELYPTVHNNELIVAGGIAALLGAPYFTNNCFAYSPAANSWRSLPDLPEDLHHVALTSCAGTLYAVGGFHGSYEQVWQMREAVYRLTDAGWEVAGRLPQAQAEGVVTCHEDTIHLVTGQSPKGDANAGRSDHHEVAQHWRWQSGDEQWQTAAPIPTPRNSASGGWVNGLMVIAGGRTARGNLAVTEIYDPLDDRWHRGAPMPLPQAGTAAAVVDNGLVVFGGEIFRPSADVFANVWHYSLQHDQWRALSDLPTPRHGLGAGRIGEHIYVVGGATKPGGSGTTDINDVLSIASI